MRKIVNKVFGKIFVAFILATGLGLLTAPAYANDNDISVTINNTTDACANIDGVQNGIPLGMQRTTNGACFTPVFDACLNFVGIQPATPNGFARDPSGNCIEQKEEIDVCSNIDGIQATVPKKMITNDDNECYTPVTDKCSNIDGTQEEVPEGMLLRNEVECYTPTPITPPSTTNTPNLTDNPVAAAVVNALPESFKQIIRETPPEVARTFPYYIFAGIGIAAAVLFAQALAEAAASRRFLIILGKQRSVAEQKDNFIMLASHYMHTPLTLMKDGVTTVNSLNEVPPETTAPLATAIANLKTKIEEVLEKVNKDTDLKEIAPPPKETPLWRSWSFILPIVLSLLLTLFANFLFSTVANIDLGAINLLAQVIMALCAVVILYTAIRNYRMKKRNRRIQEQLITNEESIDKARNEFITSATERLSEGLGLINLNKSVIDTAPHNNFFYDGYKRFVNILGKFKLLGAIQSGISTPKEPVNVHTAVGEIIAQYQASLDTKKITIQNNAPNKTISTQKLPFYFVLQSLIDNAIKYSNEGGAITINNSETEGQLEVTVSDHGTGVSKEKLGQLFKPFSRAEDVHTFDYEGLGFSLFLDKIILESNGGSIRIDPQKDHGTTVTITTPLVPTK